MSPEPFVNRAEAGARLADALCGLPLHDPLVLAIPRGGILVAEPVARALGADLDVVLARKLRAPFQPELAIGAVGEAGEPWIDRETCSLAMADDAYVRRELAVQRAEIARRARVFRSGRDAQRMGGRSVIVVDDGLATGSTMVAALRAARAEGATEVIAAVPVAAAASLQSIERCADRVVCVERPATFWAVGQFYTDFREVTDAEVAGILRRWPSRESRSAGTGSAPAG